MTPLKIAAATTLLLPAAEQPEPLRERLQAACPNPPRRISRLIELALIGAHRCMNGARPEPRCPLYLALTHGCVGDGVALVKLVTAQQQMPPPVSFINVSSNMACFYVAQTLGIHGSNQAVAADDFAFESALELASLGREHRAQGLIGAVEECAWPLAEHRVRLALPAHAGLAESSHWLFVDQNAPEALATVQWVRRYRSAGEAREALLAEKLPPGGMLALSRNLVAERGDWELATGLRLRADPVDVHSGHWTAHRICRFVETRPAPALLHVSQGRRGCAAVYVTT